MVTAYYSTGYGLRGCYLDDSQGSPQAFTSRKELADAIRNELQMYEMPASLFREVGIRRLWGLIVHARSASSFTFYLDHGAFRLSFYGLTQAEYEEAGED